MGLLDDAIREHLELKRRRGADPAEVARDQQEALEPLADPVPSSDFEASTEEHALEPGLALEEEAASSGAVAQGHALPGAEDAQPGQVPLSAPESATHGRGDALEETAELDMSAVLEETSATASGAFEQAAGLPGSRSEELLEEAPGAIDDLPEQGHLRFEQGTPGGSGLDG